MPGFELFGKEERKHVNDVLESGILMRYGFDGLRGGHWKAKEFEKEFAKRQGVKHCQLVSSGTAALTVGLASAGIGAGDEVIMPTFTFVASFEAIFSVGAVPILVDIDDTLTMNPKAVEAAITPKTKCVMPVHMCGSMADMKALEAICEKHNLILLEDACQALGATYNGKAVGTIGDLGCYSFDFVKTITCGEGGAVVTNNDDYARHADHYQDHGHDHIGKDRGAEGHPFIGYNYRISELNAAVGLAQLEKIDTILDIQKKNYSILYQAIENIEAVTFRRVPEGGEGNYSFLDFFMPDQKIAERAHKALVEAGLDGCFYWFKNNWHYINGWQYLKDKKTLNKLPKEVLEGMQNLNETDFSSSHEIMGRTISVLIKLNWTEEEVQKRGQILRNILSGL